MYASVFFANLASIGHGRLLPPPLRVRHASASSACSAGPTTDPGSPTSGPDRRRTMTLRWTFDERVEDGLVAGYALKRAKQILEDPVGGRASADRLVAGRHGRAVARAAGHRRVPRRLPSPTGTLTGCRGPERGGMG